MNIIIPLCGKGERFKNAGYTSPKPLINVLGKPILAHLVSTLSLVPKDKLYIVYSPYNKDISSQIKLSQHTQAHIQLIEEAEPTRGATETVHIALSHIQAFGDIDKPTLVIDGDAFYTIDILEMFRKNATTNAVISFVDTSNPRDTKYSYVATDQDGCTVTAIAEKRRISDLANTGAYFFASGSVLKQYCDEVLQKNITTLGEMYMSCVVDTMLKDHHTFMCHTVSNKHFMCLGTPQLVDNFVNQSYAFLFDLDGTIVHVDETYRLAWNDILVHYNMMLDESMFNKYICGKSDASVVNTILPCANVSEISSLKDMYLIKYLKNIKITPGFVPFLHAIKERGHRVAIVTNSNRRAAEYIISHIEIQNMVDLIVIGAECTRPKPSGDPYAAALSHFHLPSSRAVIFEDSETGIQSALAVRPHCIVGISPPPSARRLVDINISSFEGLDVEDLLSYKHSNARDEMKKAIAQSLARKYDVKAINIGNLKMKGGFIADVFDVVITLKGYDDDDDSNKMHCVAKMRSTEYSMMNKVADNLDLHGREYYFYENIANYINIRCPRCISLIKNSSFETCGVLLQNMYTEGCVIGCDMNVVSVDVPLKILDNLAQLHSSFWNKDLTLVFPQLRKVNDELFYPRWGKFIRDYWPTFKKHWSGVLTAKQIRIGERIVDSFDSIQASLSTGDLTLCHGDVKSANIFFDTQGNPIFLDWQYITCGKGVQDLMFFIIESFDVAHVSRYLELFKEYYYTKLCEGGVISYSKAQFLEDCDSAVCCFPFFVAIWFGTMPIEQLLDVNFPGIFIQKLFHFYENHTSLALA